MANPEQTQQMTDETIRLANKINDIIKNYKKTTADAFEISAILTILKMEQDITIEKEVEKPQGIDYINETESIKYTVKKGDKVLFSCGLDYNPFIKMINGTYRLKKDDKSFTEKREVRLEKHTGINTVFSEITKMYDEQEQKKEANTQQPNKQNEEKKLDPFLKDLMIQLIHSNAVRINAHMAVSDSCDEGDYEILGNDGKVLFRFTVNPYTMRVFRNNEIIAECHIEPIRDGENDDIRISDKAMFELFQEIYLKHENSTKTQQYAIINSKTLR